jgi:tRNA pseudouridine55 synthase
MMKTPLWNGLLVLDKPAGVTSHDVVDQVRRWFPRGSRVGHTGTLDPLATGVLVVCVGPATRLVGYVQRMQKTYGTTLLLGAQSDTDDADGTITHHEVARIPDAEIVTAVAREFLGDIEQTPPAYSAAKLQGRRAYDLARRGEQVELDPRCVHVYGLDVLRYSWPQLELEVRCGKGTYIRSLARDLGERLGVGGLVLTLRRTRVGPFTPERALPLDSDAATARKALLPSSEAVSELPTVTLSREDAQRLRHGQRLPCPGTLPQDDEVAVFERGGSLVAVAMLDRERRVLVPDKVLG